MTHWVAEGVEQTPCGREEAEAESVTAGRRHVGWGRLASVGCIHCTGRRKSAVARNHGSGTCLAEQWATLVVRRYVGRRILELVECTPFCPEERQRAVAIPRWGAGQKASDLSSNCGRNLKSVKAVHLRRTPHVIDARRLKVMAIEGPSSDVARAPERAR